MVTVAGSLARLREAASSGALASLCEAHGLEIVVLFGSALTADEPGDVDIAVGFAAGGERDFLAVVNALADLVPGDHLDVMDLNRADPVAQRAAMFGGDDTPTEVLYEASAGVAAERQIQAFMAYEDTRWLRRLQRESLQR